LLLIVLTGLAYGGLFIILRAEYWRQRRRQGGSGRRMKFKRPFLLINPKSGDGRAIKARIPKLAKAMGITVHVTKKGEDFEVLAEQAVKNGADVLGVSGGDGTIGVIAKVAMKHNLPLVVLPGGTRCHFARDIGLDPKRITDALAGFYGVERRIDVGSINDRVFLNNASFGLYADIVDEPAYRDNKLAVTRQVLQDHLSGKRRPYSLRIKQKGHDFSKAILVQVCVGRYNSVSLFELGQRQALDTGVLQVSLVDKLDDKLVRSGLKMIALNRLKKGTPAGFYQWDSKSLKVGSRKSKIIVGVDGEREAYKTPVAVKNLPRALRLFVPAEGVRGRPQKSFSLRALKDLWQETKGQVK
jgi:diacylglycerol kinase family enzyme